MGQKMKGGLWCPSCQAPRMGVKNRHRVRNTFAAPLAVVSYGAALGAGKREKYVCTTCGTPLIRR